MGLETGTYVSDLNKLWPLDSDLESQGAAHLRLLKSCLQNTFPAIGPGSVPVWMGTTPPASPQVGALWWDTNGGQLYVWYNDGTSSQWVATVNIPQASTQGVTDGSSAAAGLIGEYIQATGSFGPSGTTGSLQNALSLGLTAGDWDVWGQAAFGVAPGGLSVFWISVSSTSGASMSSNMAIASGPAGNVGNLTALVTGVQRFSFAVSTTIYLVVQQNFTGGTFTINCGIYARRRR